MGRHTICRIVISPNGEYVDVNDARGKCLARFDDEIRARDWAEGEGYDIASVKWAAK